MQQIDAYLNQCRKVHLSEKEELPEQLENESNL